MTLAGLAVLLFVVAAALTGVGVALRQAPAWEAGLGALVGGLVLLAATTEAHERWWVLAVAPALVLMVDVVRLVADAWWRGGRRLIEPAVVRAAASGALVVAATSVAAGLAVAGAVPSGTVPGGMLAVALFVPVALLALLSEALRRLGPQPRRGGRWRTATGSARRGGAMPPGGRGTRIRLTLGPGNRLALVLAVVVAGAVLVAAGSEAEVDLTGGPSSEQDAGSGGGAPGATTVTDPPPPTTAEDAPSTPIGSAGWWTVLLGVVLALAAVALYSQREQIVPPEDLVPDPLEHGPPEPVLHAPSAVQTLDRTEVLAAVDDALVRLRDDADPRVAVRVAYATVAVGLGHADLARGPAETEGEYLRRVLVLLGAGGIGLQRLTDLFSVARFSEDRVDEAMRAEALALLGDLRTAVARGGPPAADRLAAGVGSRGAGGGSRGVGGGR